MKEIWGSLNKFYFANFTIVFAIIFSIIFMFFVQFKVEKLQDVIAQNRVNISDYEDQIRLLEVEWVYLTRPERLRQISTRFLKNNGYALASQIKGEGEIEKFYNANYSVENSQENNEILTEKSI
jgi:hypothetical protein